MSGQRVVNDLSSAPPLLCPELRPIGEAHRNPWFKIMDRGGYFTLEYDQPQVVVLPVVDRDKIVMVRVNRPVIGDRPLELPAGGASDGETPREAARRELAEETGVFVADLSRLAPLAPISEMPGRMPVLLSVFQVDLTSAEFAARRPFDDGEIVSVELFAEREIADMIADGRIYLSSPMAILARRLFINRREKMVV